MTRTLRATSEMLLYRTSAQELLHAIEAVLKKKKVCRLGIVGGRTIPQLLKAIYALRRAKPKMRGALHVFWLDERIRQEKNFLQAAPLFDQLCALAQTVQWHPLKSLNERAMKTETTSCLAVLRNLGSPLAFDVVIVSAGEDGHVASLFPKSPLLRSRAKGYAIVRNAPKPPRLRTTVTPALLCSGETFLFFMAGKEQAYEQFSDPKTRVEVCPAKLLLKAPALTVCVLDSRRKAGKHL